MKIVDFVVSDIYQNQGIGSWMLHTSLLLGQQAGIRTIWGEIVSTDNVERLLPYYRRNGFEVQTSTDSASPVRAIISRQVQ